MKNSRQIFNIKVAKKVLINKVRIINEAHEAQINKPDFFEGKVKQKFGRKQ